MLVLGQDLPISAADAGDWPQWQGPGRAGVWASVRLPRRLEPGAVEKLWSAEVGGGFSGVVVVGNRVLTMDRVGSGEEERVLCLDRKDGSLLWTHSYPALYGDLDWGKGPRATPAVDGGEVFALGAVGRVTCLSLSDGKPLWSLDLQKRFGGKQPTWGHSASPLVVRDLVNHQARARAGAT
ncbi:MAG: PQQ-binding-like beta-propeller repeat protein, partial [Acidobacteriota bacterium]|nr:PQQ-binding-like beta-propeller repeat protein [Acidobacteriota bacterium]